MIIKEMWFFLAGGKSGKFASGQERHRCCEGLWKVSCKVYFLVKSFRKCSENHFKTSKTKSRVILIFLGGNILRSFCCWINKQSIEHNYDQQANKTSGQKSCLGSKTKQIRCRVRVYTSSCFLHIDLKRSYDIIAYNKML